MSVEIYGTEDYSEKFRCIAVSGEEFFNTFWQKAIDKLGLRLIGNGVWLYKKDLEDIVGEFSAVREYAAQNKELSQYREDITALIGEIIDTLKCNWNEVPDAERLWMG